MVREQIEFAVDSVQSVLSRSRDLGKAEKDVIHEATCRMAYRWCQERAIVRAINDYLKEEHPETYKALLANYRSSKVYNAGFVAEMQKEWPYEDTY